MKKTTTILAVIAAAVAALAAAPAQAGGKRLHFGGPIGHFNAFPHSNASHNNSYKRRQLAKKKAAQRRAAARKAHARKVAARKVAARKAHARKVQARKVAALKAQKAKQLARLVTKEANAKVWKAPVRASAIAGANSLNLETPADKEPVEEAAPETTQNADENLEVAELECKKYVASAGLTITVPCGS